MQTKVCKKCNRELPATKEYFYVVKRNNDGLHGTCKECRKKQNKKKAIERRSQDKHLIHSLVCDWCGKNFKGDTRDRRFCSTDCQYTWQGNSFEYKEIHKDNGLKPGMYNQFGSPREREQRFAKQFEELNPRFKYHSDYTGAYKDFKSECRICGHIQERNAQAGRPSNANVVIQCTQCNQKKRFEGRLIELLERHLRNKERAIAKLVKLEVESLQRIARNHRYYLKCEECGRNYFSNIERITCSAKCLNKRHNRNSGMKRRERLIENGNIDWDINIERLIERDGDKCYLCNESLNKDDCYYKDDGTFIAGNRYPSIDHVVPISRGGTHSWDNVKLAHRDCNSTKGSKKYKVRHDNQLSMYV